VRCDATLTIVISSRVYAIQEFHVFMGVRLSIFPLVGLLCICRSKCIHAPNWKRVYHSFLRHLVSPYICNQQ
jgi:hypothetical protein